MKVNQLVAWVGLQPSKYYDWRRRQGQENQHNGQLPREHWLEAWEKEAIIDYYQHHSEDGYRRLAYMMLDEDVVAVSPSSVYRVLTEANLLKRWSKSPSRKGTGFHQPSQPHQHWHIDLTYLKVGGTFYYLCSILDGYSRYLVHWEIREQMTETDVEIIIQRAREKFPEVRPRLISDNGSQFIARDFKEFIRQCEMSHVRTSPGYPQSNGKMERWYKTVKVEAIRPKTPLTVDQARQVVAQFVLYYNTVRLHSAIGYITPEAKLLGRETVIFAERKRKLQQARKSRRQNRQLVDPTASSQSQPEPVTTNQSAICDSF